jgi:hypothetical protein
MVRIPRRALVVAVLFTFFTVFDLTLSAQTFVLAPQPTAPQSAASPSTPDGKAFTDANKIPEPGKKIEALEKFLREFPESTRKTQAYDVVFTALVKNFPEECDFAASTRATPSATAVSRTPRPASACCRQYSTARARSVGEYRRSSAARSRFSRSAALRKCRAASSMRPPDEEL